MSEPTGESRDRPPNIFHQYTDDQLIAGISNALADGNIEAVEVIMLVLVGQNPARAVEVHDTMRLGILLASDGHSA